MWVMIFLVKLVVMHCGSQKVSYQKGMDTRCMIEGEDVASPVSFSALPFCGMNL